MKAITLTQPWASAIALGWKRIETRSWYTSYRGPLLIHAAKTFPPAARKFAEEERAMGRCPDELPLGALIARARLVKVVPTTEVVPSDLERRLGDFWPRRWAWLLEDVEPLPEPIPCKGALGLWEYP